jgi:hypothetical protein
VDVLDVHKPNNGSLCCPLRVSSLSCPTLDKYDPEQGLWPLTPGAYLERDRPRSSRSREARPVLNKHSLLWTKALQKWPETLLKSIDTPH